MKQNEEKFLLANHADLLQYKRGLIPNSDIRSVEVLLEYRESCVFLKLNRSVIDQLGIRPVFPGKRIGGTGGKVNTILYGPIHILKTGDVLFAKVTSEGEPPSMEVDLIEPVAKVA